MGKSQINAGLRFNIDVQYKINKGVLLKEKDVELLALKKISKYRRTVVVCPKIVYMTM